MTDLDRRIAELKGWCPSKERREKAFRTGNAVNVFVPLEGWGWSTSDTDALKLVDEFLAENPDASFDLAYIPGAIEKWGARFCVGRDFFPFMSPGPNRREAICRAYIAAMESLLSRKKEA
jgi:hypothetical protein